MSTPIEVMPDPEHPAGHAVMRVVGAARLGADARLRIRRPDYQDSALGPSGWQVAEAELTPLNTEVRGADLLLFVGPSIVDHLTPGVYNISVPGAVSEVPVLWPEIPLLPAGATARISRKAVGATPLTGAAAAGKPAAASPGLAATPATQPLPPAAPATASAAVAAPQKKRSLAWLVVLVLLVVAAAGGAYYWRRTHPTVHASAPSSSPPTQPPPASVAAVAAPDLGSLSVAEVIQRAPSTAAMLDEADRRRGAGKADDWLLLTETAADRNDARANAALGLAYDPSRPRSVDLPQAWRPDAGQAAKHYKQAAEGGEASVREPREKLRRWLEQRAQAKDLDAQTALKAFWP